MLTIADKLSFEDHVQMVEIEKNYWDKKLISSPEVTFAWYNHNPWTLVAVRDIEKNILAGHVSLIPIDDEIFLKIKDGKYIDTEIPIEHIKKYNKQGNYKLYCCSIAIDPLYKGSKAFKIMIKEYANRFNLLEKKGLIFTDVISDSITSKGEKLSKFLGMKLINNSNHNSKIMWVDGSTFKKSLLNILI
jgi:hypothetical protein